MEQVKKVVEILVVGHAFEQGARGENGGKPSKDSVWGVAKINGNLVTFSGRRMAKIYRFKTYKRDQEQYVMARAMLKLAGKDINKREYEDVTDRFAEVRPDLEDFLKSNFYKEMAAKKLNTRG